MTKEQKKKQGGGGTNDRERTDRVTHTTQRMMMTSVRFLPRLITGEEKS